MLTLSSVGTIGHQVKPAANARSHGLFGITLPTRLFTRRGNGNEATNKVASSESRSPSRLEYPLRRLPFPPRGSAQPPAPIKLPPNPFIQGPIFREDESPQERFQREQEEAIARAISDTIDKQIDLDKVAFRRYQNAIKVLLLGQSESG